MISPITNFIANSLSGGAERALDWYYITPTVSHPYGGQINGDKAYVTVGGNIYFFVFDSTSTDAENVAVHPYKIRPDDYTTQGVWIEQKVAY